MSNKYGFKVSKKKTTKWGEGGITGGGTEYSQISIPGEFKIVKQSGLNQHKATVKTDKPYDAHLHGKN
jgi:hypothetical protein